MEIHYWKFIIGNFCFMRIFIPRCSRVHGVGINQFSRPSGVNMATLKNALGTIYLFVPRAAIVLSFGQLLECRTYLVSAVLAQDAHVCFFRIHACHAPSLCKMELISKAFFDLISFAICRTIFRVFPSIFISISSFFPSFISSFFPLSFSHFSWTLGCFQHESACPGVPMPLPFQLCYSLLFFPLGDFFSAVLYALSQKIPTRIHSWGVSGA